MLLIQWGLMIEGQTWFNRSMCRPHIPVLLALPTRWCQCCRVCCARNCVVWTPTSTGWHSPSCGRWQRRGRWVGNHVNAWGWTECIKDGKNHVGFVIFNHGCFMCSEALLCPEMFVARLFKNMYLSKRVHRVVNNARLMCVNALVSLHVPFLHMFFLQHKAISLWTRCKVRVWFHSHELPVKITGDV